MSERRRYYNSPSAASSIADDRSNPIGENRNDLVPTSYSSRPPQPHELTAEWTVRAQLTFARAGEKVQREFSSNDPLNPVRVVYKWSTLDATAASVDIEDDLAAADDDDIDIHTAASTLHRTTSSHGSGQSTPKKFATTIPSTPKRNQSFRSTCSSLNAPISGCASGDGGGGGGVCGGIDSAFSRTTTPSTSSTFKQPVSSSVPAGSGVATAAFYGTRCRSTCNIVVSAVADFLPPDATTSTATGAASSDYCAPRTRAPTAAGDWAAMEPDPFVYNTKSSSYTVLPQKSLDDNSTTATTSTNFTALGRVLALRDAFSQTSDTETRYFEQPHGRYPNVISATARNRNSNVEGKATMPTASHTPPSTFKSSSMSRIPSMLNQQQQQQSTKPTGSTEPQKKPRTVHIDVYCTGSEDDDHADGEASSSSSLCSSEDERHELDSVSTPQTVLDNEQMRLRHQRITGQALPRRLAGIGAGAGAGTGAAAGAGAGAVSAMTSTVHQKHQHQQQKQQLQLQRQQNLSSQSDLNLGHALTKSSTAEEVSESKQLLFRKHIGDQRAAKLATLRQKYLRQTSDDALSSTYPNSSRSTVRDATWSSISSAVPSTHGQHDAVDSSWKETEEAEEYHSIGKSDSFDYANSVDRFRIRQMEKYWSRDEGSKSITPPVPVPSQQQSQPQPHPQPQPPPQTVHPRSSHSPTKHHYLQTISEVNSQANLPRITPASAPSTSAFQRNDTINSDLETFSAESDVNIGGSGGGAFLPYRRQLSQPTQRIQYTPSPPKAMKPPSPILHAHTTSHFPRNRPGFLQFFGPPTEADSQQSCPMPPPPATELLRPSTPHAQRWKSEIRENVSSSNTPATSEHSQRTSPQIVSSPCGPASPQRCGSEAPSSARSPAAPALARRFDMHRHSPSSANDTPIVLPGYTQEYLEKARKFGNVVLARKPGHHVGPTKNPNCSCESCQRWLAERFQLRGRAFSLGERPILKRPTRD